MKRLDRYILRQCFGVMIFVTAALSAAIWLAQSLRLIDLIPFELQPGIDYAAHVIGPDGHCIQLYHCMEQVGWDGRPRPAAERRRVEPVWPQTIEAASDTYVDQVLQGPLG